MGPIPFFHIMIKRVHVQALLHRNSRHFPHVSAPSTDPAGRRTGPSLCNHPAYNAQALANQNQNHSYNTSLGPLSLLSFRASATMVAAAVEGTCAPHNGPQPLHLH